jgi:hypothetical protein
MKRVLQGLGALVLLVVVVFGVLLVSRVRQDAATDAYCDKLIALAKQDKVELKDGGKKCYGHVALMADSKDPNAKAVWKCNDTCIGTAKSYDGLKQCESECSMKIVAAGR